LSPAAIRPRGVPVFEAYMERSLPVKPILPYRRPVFGNWGTVIPNYPCSYPVSLW